jgi:Flp pilus assembly pilin Flp
MPASRLLQAGATPVSMIHHGNEERMPAVVAALVKRLVVRDDGQDLLEYGLLVTLIALVAIAAVSSLGSTINTILWQPIANNF